MFYLSPNQIDCVQSVLDLSVGKHFTEMWRYAGIQRLDFGSFPPVDGEYVWGLGASCEWRIIGPDRFSLGSWNFGRKGKRFDDHAGPFYDLLGELPLIVTEAYVDQIGSLVFAVEGGYRIDVNPDMLSTRNDDQWRIQFRHDESDHHLVLTGKELYRTKGDGEDCSIELITSNLPLTPRNRKQP